MKTTMMKKLSFCLMMIALLCFNICALNAQGRKSISPASYKKEVSINVEGKSRAYYFLDSDRKSVITVKGPGKLQVLSRVQFVPSQKGKVNYNILYTVDGGTQKEIKVKSADRSTRSTFADGALGVPSHMTKTEILLNRGTHTIEFNLPKNSPGVAVRFIFTPTKEKKREWIGFYTAQSSDIVELVANETSVSYYRFSAEKPLRVEVIGPTELRVFTRVEFTYNMRGNVHYRVQVKNNDRIINTYQMSSRRSEATSYLHGKDLVPGKACEFIINVPPGKQVYELLPLDKDKNSILVRMMIPKVDVKKKR